MCACSGDHSQYEYLTNSYMVHIDDATSALICLLEYGNANGRYICSSDQISFYQIYELLCHRYPEYHVIFYFIFFIDFFVSLSSQKKDPITNIFPLFYSNLMETKNGYRKFSGLSSRKLVDTGFKLKHGINAMYDGAIKCCKKKDFL